MSTCRLCKLNEYDNKSALLKYGVRHYAHAECGLIKWGAAFFDMLHDWQLRQFPALVAKRHGLLGVLEQRIEQLDKERTT